MLLAGALSLLGASGASAMGGAGIILDPKCLAATVCTMKPL
ncbi:MAG: hypothetical protein Q8K11_14690 [Phenylobacterium sp.]|nr:hypothetical protein [Phenylobacterium sp.]MDP2011416.1 hypothetical protein [Phenylobacterium sp.]MDP3634953.1 hypothetical protein [Phenylobacterium sp.]MDZ4052105.1 hypothetical protein [Phenylobacterium sp.]